MKPATNQDTVNQARPARAWGQWLPPAGTLLVGIALSVGLFAAARGQEAERLA